MGKFKPRSFQHLVFCFAIAVFTLWVGTTGSAAGDNLPSSERAAFRCARLETALFLRERGLESEDAGRSRRALRSFEESLLLYPDRALEERLALIKKEVENRAAPVTPPAPLLVKERVSRLEKAAELRKEGKDAYVRRDLEGAARILEESLELFDDPELLLFLKELRKELALNLSLDDLERLLR